MFRVPGRCPTTVYLLLQSLFNWRKQCRCLKPSTGTVYKKDASNLTWDRAVSRFLTCSLWGVWLCAYRLFDNLPSTDVHVKLQPSWEQVQWIVRPRDWFIGPFLFRSRKLFRIICVFLRWDNTNSMFCCGLHILIKFFRSSGTRYLQFMFSVFNGVDAWKGLWWVVEGVWG